MVRSGSNDAVDAHKSLLRVLPGARLQVETAQCREAEEAHHLKVVARCACIQRGVSAFGSDLLQSELTNSNATWIVICAANPPKRCPHKPQCTHKPPSCRAWPDSAS